MARYVVVTPVTVSFTTYAALWGSWPKGAVAELTAAQVTAIGAGNLRAVTTTTAHDQLGESAGVSNGN
jgi:hypothetical protein